ncbi:glycosyltransferase family 4 protein [Patescibacteria group bacterium]
MTFVKKTLLITQDFPPLTGGIANYYSNRVYKMQSNEIVVLMNRDVNMRIHANDAKNFKIYYKNFFTKLIWPHWLLLIFQAYKIIKKEKPNMLWVGQVLPVGTVVWLLNKILKIKYFVTCHGNDLLRAKNNSRKFKLAKKILVKAEYVEANTKFTQQILINDFNISSDKIKIIYPENTLSKNQVNQEKVVELKRELNLSDKKVLITVARLVKSKGIEKIIKLMPELLKQIPNLVYIIVGDGFEKENLEKISNEKIIFIGNVPHAELPNYYSLADCFVLVPQKNEGDTESFGIVYLEALEFGLPVIAGNVGGAKEIAEKNSKMILVDSENQVEVLENILNTLNSLKI